MIRGSILATGMGLGALLMYIFDPGRGARRRSLARDKVMHAANKLGDAADATTRDLRNRMVGMLAETRSRFTSEEVDDDVLVERVRSKMGRVVSHPGAIEVAADSGRITLRGQILSNEAKRLLRTVRSVRGVQSIENQLQERERQDSQPSLQGRGTLQGSQMELAESNWAPAPRLLVGTLGSSLVAYGVMHRNPLGIGLGTVGLGLLARAATNMEMRRITGIGAGHRSVDIQKSINIAAPVEEVFRFWDNYENFPHFMRNVREVRVSGGGLSHWVVAGPAGSTVEWDAITTKRISNKEIAWKTISGPSVENAGMVQFDSNADGTTRVTVRLSYNPPAGVIGHAVATLFGANPKKEMDEDLVRLKTMIETGNPPHDASQPIKERSSAIHDAG